MSVRTQKWTALSGVHAPPTRGQTEARGAQKFCAVSFPHRGWCVLVCVYPMYRVPYMNVPVAVPTRDAGLAARPARWCIVTSDNRPRDGTPLSAYWVLHAAINEIYAESHGYGYLYVHLSNRTTPCEYLTKGGSSWRRRDATWCKVPAVAHVLLHGLPSGRQCSNVLYLDSDAHVSNWSLSIDDYLARAKDRGDEALQDDRWQILFSSNYWFEPDSLNTGAWFIRNTASACGLLRFWWGRTQFPNYDVRLPYEIGLEQEVMRRMYVFGRPWGERVRLLPTARFYRRDDYAWRQKGREHSSWAATRAPERSYSHDDFIHHGQKRHARDIAWLVQTLRQAQSSLRRDPGGFDCWCVPDRDSCDASGHIKCRLTPSIETYAQPTLRIGARELGRVFSSSLLMASSCALAQPQPTTIKGFEHYQKCCGTHRAPKNRRPHTFTHLNGTPSTLPRPCWREARWGTRKVEEWAC